MKLFLAAAVSALILTGCSQAYDDTSCVERANKNFNKCLSADGGECTANRLHEVAICDASRSSGSKEIVPAAGARDERHPSLRDDAS